MFKKSGKVILIFSTILLLLPFYLGVIGADNGIIASSAPELLFSTYFGGSKGDEVGAVAVDSSKDIIVIGTTMSQQNFPILNAFQPNAKGENDAFVAKFSSTGQLIFSTYLGGTGVDSANGVSVDGEGNIYVSGNTRSTNFPLLNPIKAFGDSYNGDVFVAKFSPNGTLIYSTYLGGYGNDIVYGMAVDSLGSVYITGNTNSSNFPIINAFQPLLHGTQDAYIAKLSPNGQSLLFSTFLGGSSGDSAFGIAVSGMGNIYVTGTTGSFDFPLSNPYQNTLKGTSDAFVTEFSVDGTSIVYSTFLGGNQSLYSTDDIGNAIVVNLEGNAIVVGSSTSSNFPVTDTNSRCARIYASGNDIFVTKFSVDGTTLASSKCIVGSGNDDAKSVVVDNQNDIYISGTTNSNNFPVINPYDSTKGDTYDAFLVKMSSDLSTFHYSTYLGGSNWDYGHGLAVDSVGNAYIVGDTYSSDFPVFNAYQNNYVGTSGWADGFVLKIGFTNRAPTANAGLDQSVNEGQMTSFDSSGSIDPDGIADITNSAWDFGDGATTNGIIVNHTYADNGIYTATLTVTDTANHTSTDTAVITINNVAPVVEALSTIDSVLPGISVSTSAAFTDAGTLDTHMAAFDWGDGMVTQGEIVESSGSGNITGGHTYSSSGVYTITLTVTDKDSASTSSSTSVSILTPAQATQNLTDLVQTFNLQQGIENSLDAKLDNAVSAFSDLNQNNNQAATNSLQAFINAVEAQRGIKITDVQADTLIQQAQQILSSI